MSTVRIAGFAGSNMPFWHRRDYVNVIISYDHPALRRVFKTKILETETVILIIFKGFKAEDETELINLWRSKANKSNVQNRI